VTVPSGHKDAAPALLYALWDLRVMCLVQE